MTGGTVGAVGERTLIARIAACFGPPPGWVRAGIGDDAAVVEQVPRTLEVLTTDALVEGVHFDRSLSSPHDIGTKALAVNLSDLASMGATPRLALLSLGLPASMEVEAFDGLVAGVAEVASAHRTAVIGGNLTRSPGPMFVDVTAVGHVHPRKALRRGGGRPGDVLYVTGTVGGAAAGLRWLRDGGTAAGAMDPVMAEAVARYRRPEPRVRFGELLGRTRAASACIDVSDGLAPAVRQLAEASGTGAVLDLDAVPWDAALGRTWRDARQAADAGLASDDYELLIAVPPRRRRAFEAIAGRRDAPRTTRVGTLTTTQELVVRRGGEEAALPAGYAHFAE